jgi:hypothetical protein
MSNSPWPMISVRRFSSTTLTSVAMPMSRSQPCMNWTDCWEVLDSCLANSRNLSGRLPSGISLTLSPSLSL